jgi:hypothetical protein
MRPLRLTGKSVMAVLTAVFGAAAVIAGPGTASAAGPVTEAAHALYGVSCPAVAECVAVGFNQNADQGRGGPLAEIWNGRAWKGATLPLPAGGTSGKLVAVSCATKTKCVAVGGYSGGLLAEIWNGKAWIPAALPTDKGFNHEGLESVSCPTATRCVAVGHDLYQYIADRPDDSSTNALAAIWNGSKWTIVRLNSVLADLSSVSCPSTNSCLAVGTWLGESDYATAAVSWNGETWKVLPQTSGAAFTGVSCSSAAHCTVVGDTVDPQIASASMAGLADLSNGQKWSALRLPWPKGSDSYLTGVSCTRAGNCATAGGEYVAPNAVPITGKAAAATWNGKAWTIAKLPALHSGRSDVFNAVSCPSATRCVAVGQYEPNKTQIGTGWAGIWNGKTWKQAPV